ncbi:MAG: outer membrane beta-barrel protein [Rhodoferax sp.]|nr:outer membrane beta-barrel protein [Rhodoferax sp.]
MKKSSRVISSLALAAASLAAVSGAQAQSSMGNDLYGAGKSYIGLNAGESDFSLGNGTGAFGSERHDTAYNVYVGNYFSTNFGFEFGYTDFGRVNRAGGRTKADGINVSLVGKLPLGDSFNLLGKVGTTYGRTEVSSAPGSGVTAGDESAFGWSYGVGAEYTFSPQWSAVLQYDEHDLKYAGDQRDRISAVTLGVRYRF